MSPDDPIVRAFLEHSLVMRLGTCSAQGRPALTPLWFVCAAGRLYVGTGRATLAARNAALNPEVVLLLDAEGAGRSAHLLRLRGRATVLERLPSWHVLVRFARKYYLAPRAMRSELAHAGRWRLRQRYYAQGRAALIEIVPTAAELLRRPA